MNNYEFIERLLKLSSELTAEQKGDLIEIIKYLNKKKVIRDFKIHINNRS